MIRSPSHSSVVDDRLRREAERAKRLLVLRLAEDRDVAWKELLRPSVEVVAMPVRHEDGVDPANDLLGRERQRHGRVGDLVPRSLDRWPRAHVVEHRVDEDPAARELEDHGRAADESESHAGVLADARP